MARKNIVDHLDLLITERKIDDLEKAFAKHSVKGTPCRALSMLHQSGKHAKVRLLRQHFDGDSSMSEFEFVSPDRDGIFATSHGLLRRHWKGEQVSEERYYSGTPESKTAFATRFESVLPSETTVHKSVPVDITIERIVPVERITEKIVEVPVEIERRVVRRRPRGGRGGLGLAQRPRRGDPRQGERARRRR